jgi:hypothetical protein
VGRKQTAHQGIVGAEETNNSSIGVDKSSLSI